MMIRRPTNLFRSAKSAVNWRFNVAKKHIVQDVSVSSIPVAEPLFDTFARRHNYLRISLTERCNLRCTYCMPAEGVELTARERLLSNEELFHLVRVFASLGVEKIRLTGGEPTLRKDLAEIISGLKSIDGIKSVSITTNGVALLRRLTQYQRSGLDAINISLDSLKPDRFEKLTRRNALNRVLGGIDLALQLGYQPLKINTVLMKGVNDDELCDFTELTRDRNIEFHRVHAIRGQRVERRPSSVLQESSASYSGEVHPSSSEGKGQRHREAMASIGSRGARGIHRFNVGTFLRDMQPYETDGGRQLEGVSVRFVGGESTGRDPRRSYTTRTAGINQSWAQQQEKATRRYAEFGPYEKPTNDPYRRLNPFQISTLGTRMYSTLTHLDNQGRARMVNVGEKKPTTREAKASCKVSVSKTVIELLHRKGLPKGDATTVAEIAGVLGAKQTASLIPLCHSLPLEHVVVKVRLPEDSSTDIIIECIASCSGKTGVEMEALTGAAVASLALYDMCKSADKHMIIGDLKVIKKTGGKADYDISKPE